MSTYRPDCELNSPLSIVCINTKVNSPENLVLDLQRGKDFVLDYQLEQKEDYIGVEGGNHKVRYNKLDVGEMI